MLIWENLWAAPFASAARRSGGQLIANGRIPIQAIIASIEADEALATKETENAAETSTCGTSGGDRRARWRRPPSWPRPSHLAPHRLRRPPSWLRLSRPEEQVAAGASSRSSQMGRARRG